MMFDFLSKCVLPIIIHRSMFSSNYGLDFLEPLISLITRIFTQIEFLDAQAQLIDTVFSPADSADCRRDF